MKMVLRSSLVKWLSIHYSGNSKHMVAHPFLWVHTLCSNLYLLMYCYSNSIMIFFIAVLYNDYSIACDVSLFPSVILLSLWPTASLLTPTSLRKLYFTPQMHLNSLPASVYHPIYFCAWEYSFLWSNLELKQSSKQLQIEMVRLLNNVL